MLRPKTIISALALIVSLLTILGCGADNYARKAEEFYAIGEYLILASDDDVYHPDYLEKMDVLVDKYPEVNVFRPRVQEIDAKGIVLKSCPLKLFNTNAIFST